MTVPPSITMMRSTNRPVAHLLEVSRTAAAEDRSAVMSCASSSSLICNVTSSSNRIELAMHCLIVIGDDGFVLADIT